MARAHLADPYLTLHAAAAYGYERTLAAAVFGGTTQFPQGLRVLPSASSRMNACPFCWIGRSSVREGP